MSEFGFELNRRPISDRRVKALAVVDLFDEGSNIASGFVDTLIALSVDLLSLERLHEAFGFGVVIRIGRTAHAGSCADAFEQFR